MITSWNFYYLLSIKNSSWIQIDILRIVHLPRESSRDRESINESRVSQVSSVTSYRSILIRTPNYRRGAVESVQSNSLEPLRSITTRAPCIFIRTIVCVVRVCVHTHTRRFYIGRMSSSLYSTLLRVLNTCEHYFPFDHRTFLPDHELRPSGNMHDDMDISAISSELRKFIVDTSLNYSYS